MVRPRSEWGLTTPARTRGSHHIRYVGPELTLRLTTDAPLSYLGGEPFALTARRHFVLSYGAPVEIGRAHV